MMKVFAGARRRCFAAAVVLATATGCRSISEADHMDPDHVLVQVGGQTVAMATEATANGVLTVQADQILEPVSAIFVDGGGQTIDIPTGFWVDVRIADTTVAAFQPTEAGAASGELRGRQEGATAVEIWLMHGRVGRGHSDWESAPIPIQVLPAD